jgi:hypothetical protein
MFSFKPWTHTHISIETDWNKTQALNHGLVSRHRTVAATNSRPPAVPVPLQQGYALAPYNASRSGFVTNLSLWSLFPRPCPVRVEQQRAAPGHGGHPIHRFTVIPGEGTPKTLDPILNQTFDGCVQYWGKGLHQLLASALKMKTIGRNTCVWNWVAHEHLKWKSKLCALWNFGTLRKACSAEERARSAASFGSRFWLHQWDISAFRARFHTERRDGWWCISAGTYLEHVAWSAEWRSAMHDVMNMASSWRLMRSLCMVSAVVVRHVGFFLRPSLPIHCMGPQVVSSFDSSLPSFGIQQRFCIDMLNKRLQPNIQPHPAANRWAAHLHVRAQICANAWISIYTRDITHMYYIHMSHMCMQYCNVLHK